MTRARAGSLIHRMTRFEFRGCESHLRVRKPLPVTDGGARGKGQPRRSPFRTWHALAAFGIGALVACSGDGPVEHPPVSGTAAALSGGARWQQVSASPAGSLGPLAYDSVRNKVWHFEAVELGQCQMWDWDGTNWTLRAESGSAPGSVPGPVGAHMFSVMTYDSLRDRVVLFGGGNSRETWEWDGAAWTKRDVPVSPPSRSLQGMAYDSGRAKVVLFGGQGNFAPLNDTWEWDGTVWVERSVSGPLPPGGSGVSLAYDAGRGTTVLLSAGSTWEWDGANWQQRSPAGSPPLAGALTYDSTRGVVVLVGGTGAAKQIWHWDGANWIERTSTTSPSGSVVAYDSARDRVVLFGIGSDASANTWEWDGVNWTARVRRPPPRQGHAMVYDGARQEVVMFGNSSSDLNQTWTWKGSIWEPKLVPGPGPHTRPLMAFDGLREKVVLFGGDTWEWDGATWEPRVPSGASPVFGLAMTYDGARGITVLFAGVGGAGETWTWDGTTWTQLSPPTRPSVLFNHAMAYDSARGKVVMVSSTTRSAPVETWEWDGSDWTQRLPEQFPAVLPFSAVVPALAYDIARRRVVLFGAGTWEWDGANWTTDSSAGPPVRASSAMAYDSVRRTLVMFGGVDRLLFRTYGDTWETRLEGTPCASTTECTGGTCVDGVCCATTESSCGSCRACNVPGSVGVCAPRSGSCDDGNACTLVDTCQAGLCVGSRPVLCAPQAECRVAGSCDPATGVCSSPPAADGTPCLGGFCPTPPPEGALCLGSKCMDGECRDDPCLGVSCTATDTCHLPGVCDPTSGQCSNPAKSDGAPCTDGDPGTTGDTCRVGRCVGVAQHHPPRHQRRRPTINRHHH